MQSSFRAGKKINMLENQQTNIVNLFQTIAIDLSVRGLNEIFCAEHGEHDSSCSVIYNLQFTTCLNDCLVSLSGNKGR